MIAEREVIRLCTIICIAVCDVIIDQNHTKKYYWCMHAGDAHENVMETDAEIRMTC